MRQKATILRPLVGAALALTLVPLTSPARFGDAASAAPRPATSTEARPEGPQHFGSDLIEYDMAVESPPWRTEVDARQLGDRSRGFQAMEAIAGTARLPVALVEFRDNLAEAIHTPKAYEEMLFKRNYQFGAGSMRDYYLDQSGGLFDVEGQVNSRWELMPLKYSVYSGSDNGLQTEHPNAHTLVRDTAAAVDDEFDFCDFDFDGDGYVDTFFVIHAGPGAEETTGDVPGSGMGLWSHLSYLSPNYVTQDRCDNGTNARIGYYAMQPEEHARASLSAPGAPDRLISIGVFAHEFGHALGLPDLYDVDGDSNGGVGSWDLMASGAWGFEGFRPWRPVPFSAWTKSRVGWAIPQDVTQDTFARAITSSDAPRRGAFTGIYRLVPGGEPEAKEYFLVEYRDGSSPFSVGIPPGVAVWHVNESKLGTKNADNSDQDDRLLQLIQADGLDELGGSDASEYGDDGDLFPGSVHKTFLDTSGFPNTRLRDGSHSGIALRNIALTETGAVADLIVNDILKAPASPSGLIAQRVRRAVGLTWTPASDPDITEQRIYRTTTPGGAAKQVGKVTGGEISFLDPSPPDGTTVYYSVRSFNGTESLPSETVAIEIPLGPQAPRNVEVFHGKLYGSVAKLRSSRDGGIKIESRLYEGGQTVDYDLIYDLGDKRFRRFVFELRPERTLRAHIFIGNWAAGEYQDIGYFTIKAGERKRFSLTKAGRFISDQGQVRIGLSHRKFRDFRHVLDRAVLRFPS